SDGYSCAARERPPQRPIPSGARLASQESWGSLLPLATPSPMKPAPERMSGGVQPTGRPSGARGCLPRFRVVSHTVRVLQDPPIGDEGSSGARFTLPMRTALMLMALALILVWWMGMVAWYVASSLLLVTYRLQRRGARKRKAQALARQT